MALVTKSKSKIRLDTRVIDFAIRLEALNSSKHWICPSQLPQRDRIRSGYYNHESRTFAYSSHQVSSRSPHSRRFPRFSVFKTFRFPAPPLSVLKPDPNMLEHLRHEIFLYIKFHLDPVTHS